MPFDEEELDPHGECSAEINRLRGIVRKLAINRHSRLAEHGKLIPNGGSCDLCNGEWEEGKAENHAPECAAAITAGERQ
jgi:hypothetical protein